MRSGKKKEKDIIDLAWTGEGGDWIDGIKGGETVTGLELRHAHGLTSDDTLQRYIEQKKWVDHKPKCHMFMYARNLSRNAFQKLKKDFSSESKISSESKNKDEKKKLYEICGLVPSAAEAWVLNKHRRFYHENPHGWYAHFLNP